jgi:hypothetical protein
MRGLPVDDQCIDLQLAEARGGTKAGLSRADD